MKKIYLYTLSAVFLSFTVMAQNTNNPFFTEWDTPFGAPPFEQIKNEHYLPGF